MRIGRLTLAVKGPKKPSRNHHQHGHKAPPNQGYQRHFHRRLSVNPIYEGSPIWSGREGMDPSLNRPFVDVFCRSLGFFLGLVDDIRYFVD